jgi:hypothetical protein
MKFLRLILCAYLVSTGAQGQTPLARQTVGALIGTQNKQAQLQLTTSVVRGCYASERTTTTLRWTLRLTYTNVGRQPILLDKKSSLIPRSLVSRSLKDAAAEKYESDTTSTFLDVRKAGVRTEAAPEEDAFVTLKPGESYSLEANYGVHLYDGTKESQDFLRPGNHFLQVRVATWYYLHSPEEYRARWRDKGYLWSQTVTSLPMPFSVNKQNNTLPCS